MAARTVKMFKEERGFGFITPDGGGDDVFFHATTLRESDEIAEGASVKFETGIDEKSGKTKASSLDLA